MIDSRDRRLELSDEDASIDNLYLVTDAVLTLSERGLLSHCLLRKDKKTITLIIHLPAVVFLAALKDEQICVEEEEASAAVGVIRRGTGDTVPVASSTRLKNFIKNFFRKPLKFI